MLAILPINRSRGSRHIAGIRLVILMAQGVNCEEAGIVLPTWTKSLSLRLDFLGHLMLVLENVWVLGITSKASNISTWGQKQAGLL